MAFKIDDYRELTQITTAQDSALGIMRWGNNNAFPQTLKNLIEQSPSAKPAIERTAKFIRGGRFVGDDQIVNSMGLTLGDVVDFIATDKAMYDGFCIQTNWNVKGEVVSMTPMSISDMRLRELDELNYAVKIGYHSNFGMNSNVKKTITNSPTKGKIKWFDRFNPESALKQINQQGARKYNGQMLYFSGAGHSMYPTPPLQSAINYVLCDVENSVLVRKETSTGFINSYLLKTIMSSDDPNLIKLEQAIQSAQGARGVGKVITMSGLSPEEIQGTLLEEIAGGAGAAGTIIDASEKAYKLAKEVILGAYLIPPILGGGDQKTGFTSSELEDAYFVFNANTKPDRDIIEAKINSILKHSIFKTKEIKLQKLKLDKDEEEKNV